MCSICSPASLPEDKEPFQHLKMTFVPPPGYHPTYNPTLPFHKPIPCDVDVGMCVYIQGVTGQDITEFVVNFALGLTPESDIAFHFNPRLNHWNKVVFNSQQSGQWGQEEEKSMPFKKGELFELLVMVTQDHYKVLVNGSPFYEFGHRIPFQKVTHLHVNGDMKLQCINFFGSCPSSCKDPEVTTQLSCNLPDMEGSPVFNPPVPYVRTLQGGLINHRTIIIRGFIPYSAYRFAINFWLGTTGDIALHINPRMDQNALVRNSFQKGQWGPEERDISYNPFAPGQSFELSIRVSTYSFKVFANGQHIFDYKHRMLATLVDILEIVGDIILYYVQI